MSEPKVLVYDIETAPIESYHWGLWDQNIGLNQIKQDWTVLSWAAKWLDNKEVTYKDVRGQKDLRDDKTLLRGIWNLLDEADYVITQNGKEFDQKKLYARFVMHGFKPPSPVRHVDTLKIAKKHFGFTSNKLAYLTDKLCTKYKKLTHHKFEGFDLWKECLNDNIEAWKEMERYNRQDVLALEELYYKLLPYDQSINFSTGKDKGEFRCNCGSTKLQKRGFSTTNIGRYQRYQCQDCGAWFKDSFNLVKPKNFKRPL